MNLKKYFIAFILAIFLSISLNASSLLKTRWVPLLLDDGVTSIIPYKVLSQTPVLTTPPTTVSTNSVSIEVNGSPGFKVFIDGIYVGIIGSSGKLTLRLDVLGKNGLKHFSIYFKDVDGYESDVLTLNIQKTVPETTPPHLQATTPTINSIIYDRLTPLQYTMKDLDSDIDFSSLSVTINGQDATSISQIIVDGIATSFYEAISQDNIDNFGLVITPTNNFLLPLGNFTVNIKISDVSGNEAMQTFQYFIKEQIILSVTPLASPSTAYAPATIRFSPEVTTDNAIQDYYWDFTGNGAFEAHDRTANSYTWTYNTPGDYNVTLKVVDLHGKILFGNTIVHILNTPPQVSVESSPSNGAIPLTVSFAVTASDADGIALYEWDFDGDGVYDYNSTSTGNASFEYTEQGIFNAQLRVTDTKGATALYTTPTTKVIAASQGSPSVTASGSPVTGNAPLVVNLSASATDPQGKGFKLYEWDFDADGVYDYNSSTSASTSFTYVGAGKFYPRVKVTTTDDRITYDSLEVTVKQSVSLSVTTDTIDVLNSETTLIHTTTTARSEIKIVMEDRDHNVIRIIQDWATREAGSYDDTWDGKDASDEVVKEADYYAVVLYKEGNEIKRLDLRDTTGGTRYNPNPNNNIGRTFAPFDNRPMTTVFDIRQPSEVISFIGYNNVNTRVVTLRSREVLGSGSYRENWSALSDEKQLISPPPGKWFMYGVWAFTLADNVIYVKSGAHVSGIIATPPIFTPDSHEAEGMPATLKIHFTLNKASTIELEFFDASEGVAVATRTYSNVQAGEQIVEFDGKDNNGVHLHPGKYSVGIRAVDEKGYRSMMEYTVTRIHY